MAAPAHTNLPETQPAPVGSAAAQKLLVLEARLEQLGNLMVAYSGGVDSAFLAATAHRVLGGRMIAVL
ncbi:MAG: TIGR00268 family protein, partial [Terracidiphilus sp.]